MDFAERDEIVDAVLSRINELSDKDKKNSAIQNRKIMLDASKEQSRRMKQLSKDHPYQNGGVGYIDYPHAWRAIYEINKLVPWIIGVRYSNRKNEMEFYKFHPDADGRTHKYTVPNQMLYEDKKLAEQISRELTDVLFKYMDLESWDESQ